MAVVDARHDLDLVEEAALLVEQAPVVGERQRRARHERLLDRHLQQTPRDSI